MPKLLNSLFVLAVLLVSAVAEAAMTYQPDFEKAGWQVQQTSFHCQLSQQIPLFGQARFVTNAGEKPFFELFSPARVLKRGTVQLQLRSPVWSNQQLQKVLGDNRVGASKHQVNITGSKAGTLADGLMGGLSPVFSQAGTEVSLLSINFRPAFEQYQACLVQLMPGTPSQIERSRIFFKSGEPMLSSQAKERLDFIMRYLKESAGAFKSVYVDGHADSDGGKRLANLDLSKRRAQLVTKYLTAGGVTADMIVTRYHGERYPVANNKSVAGRNKNRRVTVRLDREPPKLPEPPASPEIKTGSEEETSALTQT